VLGAYPRGMTPDMWYGDPSERPWADEAIETTPLPEADPVFGFDGPVAALWIRGRGRR